MKILFFLAVPFVKFVQRLLLQVNIGMKTKMKNIELLKNTKDIWSKWSTEKNSLEFSSIDFIWEFIEREREIWVRIT